ncbi:HER030Wp [Eremothecium sinecaudum]|uniref:5'-deoxynucleotidase n=1 Tax=Eremothecium sinecaudum TaxID=45286 RepID=A0A0X8HTS5_9SACH|nr:HER030Wp [Eremothecium sinecaudum]AMD21309.1 HER030Wp [Eremothecium sinecaudum]
MTSDIWMPEDHIPVEVRDMLSEPSPNYVIMFLNIVELLKVQRRTGWVDYDISPCESISDHMYRMSVTCMLLKDTSINKEKCVRIALVHDLAEALVGDITPFDAVTKEEKHRREWETIKYLCGNFISKYNEEAATEIKRDWLSYENLDCPEARYVKDIDKFEMLMQCFEYERRHKGEKKLDQFWSIVDAIQTTEVGAWVKDLYARRNSFFESLE